MAKTKLQLLEEQEAKLKLQAEEIQKEKEKLASLDKLEGELSALLSKYGFKSYADYQAFLYPAAAKVVRKRLTQEDKDEIIKALKAGDRKDAVIAKEFETSSATIAKIKKEAGLTKPRK